MYTINFFVCRTTLWYILNTIYAGWWQFVQILGLSILESKRMNFVWRYMSTKLTRMIKMILKKKRTIW